jgi:hypothetical protein
MIVDRVFSMDFLRRYQLDAPTFIGPRPSKRNSLRHIPDASVVVS